MKKYEEIPSYSATSSAMRAETLRLTLEKKRAFDAIPKPPTHFEMMLMLPVTKRLITRIFFIMSNKQLIEGWKAIYGYSESVRIKRTQISEKRLRSTQMVQRVLRGCVARIRVVKIRLDRYTKLMALKNNSAYIIQCSYRCFQSKCVLNAVRDAKRDAFHKRMAIAIQKIFRGYYYRAFTRERERNALISEVRQWGNGKLQNLFERPDMQSIEAQGLLIAVKRVMTTPVRPVYLLPPVRVLRGYRDGIAAMRLKCETEARVALRAYSSTYHERKRMHFEDIYARLRERYVIAIQGYREAIEAEKRAKKERERLEIIRRRRRKQMMGAVSAVQDEAALERWQCELMLLEDILTTRVEVVARHIYNRNIKQNFELMRQEDILAHSCRDKQKNNSIMNKILEGEMKKVREAKESGEQRIGMGGKRWGRSLVERNYWNKQKNMPTLLSTDFVDSFRRPNMLRSSINLSYDSIVDVDLTNDIHTSFQSFALTLLESVKELHKVSRIDCNNSSSEQQAQSLLRLRIKYQVCGNFVTKLLYLMKYKSLYNRVITLTRKYYENIQKFKMKHVQLILLRKQLTKTKIKTRRERKVVQDVADQTEAHLVALHGEIAQNCTTYVPLVRSMVSIFSELFGVDIYEELSVEGEPILEMLAATPDTSYSSTIAKVGKKASSPKPISKAEKEKKEKDARIEACNRSKSGANSETSTVAEEGDLLDDLLDACKATSSPKALILKDVEKDARNRSKSNSSPVNAEDDVLEELLGSKTNLKSKPSIPSILKETEKEAARPRPNSKASSGSSDPDPGEDEFLDDLLGAKTKSRPSKLPPSSYIKDSEKENRNRTNSRSGTASPSNAIYSCISEEADLLDDLLGSNSKSKTSILKRIEEDSGSGFKSIGDDKALEGRLSPSLVKSEGRSSPLLVKSERRSSHLSLKIPPPETQAPAPQIIGYRASEFNNFWNLDSDKTRPIALLNQLPDSPPDVLDSYALQDYTKKVVIPTNLKRDSPSNKGGSPNRPRAKSRTPSPSQRKQDKNIGVKYEVFGSSPVTNSKGRSSTQGVVDEDTKGKSSVRSPSPGTRHGSPHRMGSPFGRKNKSPSPPKSNLKGKEEEASKFDDTLIIPGFYYFLDEHIDKYLFLADGINNIRWFEDKVARWMASVSEEWRRIHFPYCVSYTHRISWLASNGKMKEIDPEGCELLHKLRTADVADLFELLISQVNLGVDCWDAFFDRSGQLNLAPHDCEFSLGKHPFSVLNRLFTQRALIDYLQKESNSKYVPDRKFKDAYNIVSNLFDLHKTENKARLKLFDGITSIDMILESFNSNSVFLKDLLFNKTSLRNVVMQENRCLSELGDAIISKKLVYICNGDTSNTASSVLNLSIKSQIRPHQFVKVEVSEDGWKVMFPSWQKPAARVGEDAGFEPFWRRLKKELDAEASGGLLRGQGKYARMHKKDVIADRLSRQLAINLKLKLLKAESHRDTVVERELKRNNGELMFYEDVRSKAREVYVRNKFVLENPSVMRNIKKMFSFAASISDLRILTSEEKALLKKGSAKPLNQMSCRASVNIKHDFNDPNIPNIDVAKNILVSRYQNALQLTHWVTGEKLTNKSKWDVVDPALAQLNASFAYSSGLGSFTEELWVAGGLFNTVSVFRVVENGQLNPRGLPLCEDSRQSGQPCFLKTTLSTTEEGKGKDAESSSTLMTIHSRNAFMTSRQVCQNDQKCFASVKTNRNRSLCETCLRLMHIENPASSLPSTKDLYSSYWAVMVHTAGRYSRPVNLKAIVKIQSVGRIKYAKKRVQAIRTLKTAYIAIEIAQNHPELRPEIDQDHSKKTTKTVSFHVNDSA